jgi:Ulp1 family protease
VSPAACRTLSCYNALLQDAITIFNGDLKRLGPGEYLNDNLIDLQIKYCLRTALSEQLQARVHAFNCQFYTRLTTYPSNLHSGYELVARWTKNIDLFDRDFVLIPVNYSYHWSLAVVVRPGAVLVGAACFLYRFCRALIWFPCFYSLCSRRWRRCRRGT